MIGCGTELALQTFEYLSLQRARGANWHPETAGEDCRQVQPPTIPTGSGGMPRCRAFGVWFACKR